MKQINSSAELKAVLKADKVLLFVHFEWSSSSRYVLWNLEEWEKESDWANGESAFEIYWLEPDEHPDTWKWIGENAVNLDQENGYTGGLVWLRNGAVVGTVENQEFPGLRELKRLTKLRLGIEERAGQSSVVDPELLRILCCPETYQDIKVAEAAVIEKINQQIFTGALRNRRGQVIREVIEGGLVRADGRYLYPIRHNIPIMLVDEAIPLIG
ncbi:Trm112 family protein [Pedosphaera parvula]|uniref:Uncharacterized protein n=1 Tax=Pedosphaera parvula (strain Ellin514) TaxID=320771 RepID=B9XST1_PEDPL|nr:hypothetical protein [Pedosphaera parvula]EEF57098.1 hypothetical protein Cflav_PD6510 [Pedosphaera parvula Ellin514]